VGEIDIDSHTPAAFTEIDRSFLEEAARIVGAWMDSISPDYHRHGTNRKYLRISATCQAWVH
jgi:hypothetical protein